jgi:hypothetical protein
MPHVAIPIDRSKGLVTFSQLHTLAKEFKVDRKVYRLFSDNGRDIIKVVKPIITKYATDSSASDNGILDTNIQRLGRWSSDALKLYFDTSLAVLINVFLSDLCYQHLFLSHQAL